MSGRGRGRGTLAHWETNKPGSVTNRAVASVSPLNKDKERNEKQPGKHEAGDLFDDRSVLPNKRTNIEIMKIADVEHFWARIGTTEEMEKFDRYMSALNAWCDQQPPVRHLLPPAIGQLECVRHTHSGLWKRAQVTRQSDNSVNVFYLDCGEVECVPLTSLCSSTPNDITACPPQALHCALDGVEPVDGSWSQEANKMFSDVISSGHRLEAVVSDDLEKVNVFVIDNERGEFSVGNILIQEGFAVEKEDLETDKKSLRSRFKREAQEKIELDKVDVYLNSVGFTQPTQTKKSEGQSTATALTHSAEAASFAGSPTSRFSSTGNSDLKLNFSQPVVAPSGVGINRADSNTDWRVECSRVEPSRQGNKRHLASPQEFLSSAAFQDISEGESFHPGIKAPATWTQTGRGQTLTNTSCWNEKTDNSFSQPAQSQHKSLGSFFEDSQQELKGSLWQPTNPSPQAGLNSKRNSAEQQPLNQTSIGSQRLGRSSNIAANFSQVPKDSSQGMAFGMQWGTENAAYRQHPSQPQLLKIQPLSENTKDKTQKAELDWQVWKYQRNVKKILNSMTVENVDNFGAELEQLVADCRLSSDFQGVSEVLLLLQMIVDRAVDIAGFGDLAVKACIILEDLAIPGLDSDLTKVLTEFRDGLTGQLGFNNWQKKCQRFCTFLGKLFIATSTSADSISSLKHALDDLISRSLHRWSDLDRNESEPEKEMAAVCLSYMLTIIGQVLDQAECPPLSECLKKVREHVLSPHLSVDVKSTLLDLLLLRAAGWSCDRGIGNEVENEAVENVDDDVVIESDDNEAESTAPEDEYNPSDEHDQDWDTYGEVKMMLDKLKLQHLFVKFQENCIRDSLLKADKEELKKTLQEAGFPPGVILEIRMYLDKGHIKSSMDKTTTVKHEQAPEYESHKKESSTVKEAIKNPSPPPNVGHQSLKATAGQVEKSKNSRSNQEPGVLSLQRAHHSGPSNQYPPKDLSASQESPYNGRARRSFDHKSTNDGSQSLSESKEHVFARNDAFSVRSSNHLPTTIASGDVKRKLSDGASTSPDASKSYSAVLRNASSSATEERSSPAKQTLSSPRAPSGFPSLPATNPAKKLDMNTTVLSKNATTKHAETVSSQMPMSAREVPGSNREVSKIGQQAWTADTSKNWRMDREMSSSLPPPPRSARNFVKGRGVHDQSADKPARTFGPGRGTGQNTSSAPPRDTQAPGPLRPFGPGGPKACLVCGSKEHLKCRDRSKMFFD